MLFYIQGAQGWEKQDARPHSGFQRRLFVAKKDVAEDLQAQPSLLQGNEFRALVMGGVLIWV
jgi:hypothetical protein